jgi:23S rRNA pseudoU1915 N3-methylase RlmH
MNNLLEKIAENVYEECYCDEMEKMAISLKDIKKMVSKSKLNPFRKKSVIEKAKNVSSSKLSKIRDAIKNNPKKSIALGIGGPGAIGGASYGYSKYKNGNKNK